MKIVPAVSALNIRSAPSQTAPIIGVVSRMDVMTAVRNQACVGNVGVWLEVVLNNGQRGWCAGWLVRKHVEETPALPRLIGVNIDFQNPQGFPSVEDAQHFGWLRFELKASPARGFANLGDALRFYEDRLAPYRASDVHILCVLTHTFYGEGAGFNWDAMTYSRWDELTAVYAKNAGLAAQRFAEKQLVQVYQIWNEADALPGFARASVPVPASIYGSLMFSRAFSAIKGADPAARVITTGTVRGPASAQHYFTEALRACQANVRADGLAIHPYGRGAPDYKGAFAPFGSIEDEYRAVSRFDLPIYVTELGVLDNQSADPAQVAQYLRMIGDYTARSRPEVKALIWYGWSDAMDNGFGFASSSGALKPQMMAVLR